MSNSEPQLYVESDQDGATSDLGPDFESSVHSGAEQSETSSAHEEYISSRGVRFTQQQQQKDGECLEEKFPERKGLVNKMGGSTTCLIHI